MASTATRTFAIAELAEQILLATFYEGDPAEAMATLLRARRISRSLKALIDSSPSLRRALWLERPPSDHNCEHNSFVITSGPHELRHDLSNGISLQVHMSHSWLVGMTFSFTGIGEPQVDPEGLWLKMYAFRKTAPSKRDTAVSLMYEKEEIGPDGCNMWERRMELPARNMEDMTFGDMLDLAREGRLEEHWSVKNQLRMMQDALQDCLENDLR